MKDKHNILAVVVGSRLHGLFRDDADWDFRGIFMNDLADIVNPFEKPKDTRWVEGGTTDDTAYELRKFVKEVVNGNPNFVEMLFAPPFRSNAIGRHLQAKAVKFLDSARLFEAYKGYAANQLNKMELFTPDKRTPKFAVAYIRSLLNGIEVLQNGTITNPVPDVFHVNNFRINPRRDLMEIKFCPWEEFERVRPLAMELFMKLQNQLAMTYYGATPKFHADRAWITSFVREAYGVEGWD